MTLQLKKATKEKCKLRLIIMGLPGSGKTYSALEIAKYLSPNGKILLLDSEFGSASKYADLFDFYTEEMTDCDPRNYIKLIKEADQLGIDVLILDSLSHAWHALLEVVEKSGSTNKSPYGGWNKGTPIQNEFVNTMLASKCHIIATARQKSDWVLETKDNGKSVPKKVGLKVDQRQEIDYEFDVVGILENDHTMTITKSRCPEVDQKSYYLPGREFAETLRNWLESGVEPAPKPTAEAVASNGESGIASTASATATSVKDNGTTKVSDNKASSVQVAQLIAAGNENGWTTEQISEFVRRTYKIKTKTISESLTVTQWEQAVKLISHPQNSNAKITVASDGSELELAVT